MSAKVIVIGAGASGLMAAITAAGLGASVTVLEQNDRPGRKILATGNGKCNLTNLDMSPDHYRGGNSALTEKILFRFNNVDTLRFFHQLGLRTLDRNGWIYPYTEQASQVLRLLMMEAGRRNVRIKCNEKIIKVQPCAQDQENDPDPAHGSGFHVHTATWTYTADSVIIATGSPASSVRGSSDSAMCFARDLHLQIVPFLPSLVPLKIRENITNLWAGTRVHATVQLFVDKVLMASDTGEVQLTDFGISGIPVFQVSRFASKGISQSQSVRVLLDFMPDMDEASLYKDLLGRAAMHPGAPVSDLLIGLIPDKLISVFAEKTSSGKGNSAQLLRKTAARIKACTVTVTGTAGLRHAQICSGGIHTDELTEDMECRKIPGLYFTGESVNVDGPCGGYNLQWAWSSGYAAGLHAGESCC
ncbi:MAG: NAD(P)/FAD-dependent oxidoreductase [Bilifractor sp.]